MNGRRAVYTGVLGLFLAGSCFEAHADVINVDSKVRVTFSGLVLNRATGTFDTMVTIANISADTLQPPITLVVTGITPSGVTVANLAGQTVDGKPFVDVPVPSTGLPPRGKVTKVLKFANRTRTRFTFRT